MSPSYDNDFDVTSLMFAVGALDVPGIAVAAADLERLGQYLGTTGKLYAICAHAKYVSMRCSLWEVVVANMHASISVLPDPNPDAPLIPPAEPSSLTPAPALPGLGPALPCAFFVARSGDIFFHLPIEAQRATRSSLRYQRVGQDQQGAGAGAGAYGGVSRKTSGPEREERRAIHLRLERDVLGGDAGPGDLAAAHEGYAQGGREADGLEHDLPAPGLHLQARAGGAIQAHGRADDALRLAPSVPVPARVRGVWKTLCRPRHVPAPYRGQ